MVGQQQQQQQKQQQVRDKPLNRPTTNAEGQKSNESVVDECGWM
jgi:hypothetical protein